MLRLKLMWLPDHEMIWDVTDDRPMTREILPKLGAPLTRQLRNWGEGYGIAFREWLDTDGMSSLYELSSALNAKGISIARRIGTALSVFCYYWFDVDRSACPEHQWVRCPMCRRSLKRHPTWHRINRYSCERCTLVLPER